MKFKFSDFNKLWFSFLKSSIGDWLYKLALPLIVLAKTGSAYHAATIYGISFIPWIFFSLIGGSIADTFNKKRILFLGNVVSGILTVLLALFVKQTNLIMWQLYLIVFFLSSIDPLIHPTFQSILPQLTESTELITANAKIQTVDNTLSIVGPLLGGTVIVLFSGVNALWVDAITFFMAAFFITKISIKTPSRGTLSLKKLIKSIKEGASYSFGQKVIFSGSVMFFFSNFALNMFEANFMYYMTRQLKLSVFDASMAMTLAGIGSLTAGFVTPKISRYFSSGRILSVSTMLAGLFTIFLFITNSAWSVGLVLGLISFFGTINVITYFTLRQRTVPSNILGRIVSVTRMVSYASIPIGSWLSGYLISIGTTMKVIVILAGIIRLLAGAGAWLSPLGKEK
ncbi:MFS transporter [Pediococcus cellicola]|uniref:MFS transporter n=1 Tax=Pediococcus cellicola TaxID=319652 RepID=UPI00071065A6|nr:MFS transporter [Pediococcus cellicola]GEL15026.1 MFS transporter [Pediococcus cellicola]